MQRHQAALAALRRMSSYQYVSTSTAEALAAALCVCPAVAAFFTIEGIMTARFPKPVPGEPLPAIPQTFGGLLSAGLKYSLGMTARSVFWIAGTSGLSALLRESMRVGPRYQEAHEAITGARVMAVNGVGGAAITYILMAGSKMTVQRRLGYTVLGAAGGMYLPIGLSVAGPFVRKQLLKIIGSVGDDGQAPLR